MVAGVIGVAAAFRRKAVRPASRDLAALAVAVAAMAAAVRPFNGLASPLAAAAAGVSLGGSLYFAILFAFDFAGGRSFLIGKLRAWRGAVA